MDVSSEQLQEYERQLADVVELLSVSPEDVALLSLKSDLEELLALTKASLAVEAVVVAPEVPDADNNPHESNNGPLNASEVQETSLAADVDSEPHDQNHTTMDDTLQPDQQQQQATQQPPAKKKAKKMKEFEVPAHLMIHEADTEAEKSRKRRATKALKNKWRERKKEVETEMKQQSWKNFQQKTLKRKDQDSIFATQEGEHAARVGVVSASRGMTEFGERKRYKHNNI